MTLRCSVADCPNAATRVRSRLCEMHYYRMRRTGSFDAHAKAPPWLSHGYVVERAPHHPLADRTGVVRQHRRVFYDAFGAGPFLCHHCGGGPIAWNELHIDHLDDCKTNNDL